jgi:hypothetical protein
MTLAELKALAVIAAQLSGLPMPDAPLPTTYLLPSAIVQAEFCKAANGAKCIEVYAFYRKETNEIYMELDPVPYSRESVLVHELTHWLEYKNHVNQADACLDERMARVIEAIYIRLYEPGHEQQFIPECDAP